MHRYSVLVYLVLVPHSPKTSSPYSYAVTVSSHGRIASRWVLAQTESALSKTVAGFSTCNKLFEHDKPY